MVVVPLYDTLGQDAIRFIINTGENKHAHIQLAATLGPYFAYLFFLL